MKALLQRVLKASVSFHETEIASIGAGLVILLGAAVDDDSEDVQYLAEKVINLRIFDDEAGKLNLSLLDTNGEALVVSQFTLLADCRKGRRPSFVKAAAPERAIALYEEFVEALKARGISTKTGRFQEVMLVKIYNHGPVTILLDSNQRR